MASFYLIFDADDTLWENNIYFEEAFDQFCGYLAHSCLSPDQVRSVLDEIEIVNARVYGYGSRNFARNLEQCFRHLSERAICERDIETVREYAYAIAERVPNVIDGVKETLEELADRHELALFTKGDPDEQQSKLDRSGLSRFFRHVGIVKEKHEQAYRDLAADRNYSPGRTWMIGNSPKSDINPALSAGLSAVYVPHPRTWSMEQEDVPEKHPRLLTIERITELTQHF
jgi:putative hydrolase of the HAD superfamily